MFGNNTGGGMPGPAMASKMMQMMPMMASQMLSECSGEDRKIFLADTVRAIVARVTEGMTDQEYAEVVEELCSSLQQRTPSGKTPGTGCC